ncbi:MAG: histidinol-phosphate transaminase [Eubacterium sp.]|nr:histidinol-phosphate transaminase [Eubacterium sp.]
MKKFEENIRRVEPYVPGEQPAGSNIIKLNTNESPFAPSTMVQMAIASMMPEDLRKYPDPEAKALVKEIASYYDVDESKVFVGVGSDDILGMSFLTFFNSDKPVLFPDITYSFYDVWAELYGIKYEKIPLTDEFEIDPKKYKKENGGIVFANPNAPTGIALPKAQVEEIIAANPDSVVIVDEAYIDFGGETVLDLIDKYENLLVVRTFSKSRALAGMRVGYAFGSETLINALKDVKFSYNSYTLNVAAIRGAKAAIKDDEYFRNLVDEITKTREETKMTLKKMGFDVLPSATNFLFAKHESMDAKDIYEKLKEKDIYIRYFDKPRIDNYIRITIGTKEQMNALVMALEDIIK